jgi:hypothetical protein
MADIRLTPGITLLEAYRVAKTAGMHLIADDRGEVRVSPIVLPGWRKIPLRVKITAPDQGRIDISPDMAVAA